MTLPSVFSPRMRPYAKQVEGLEKGWDATGFAYLMEFGTGKSKTTIDNFCLLYATQGVRAMLLIAPKGVYTNWTRMSDENPGELQRHMWTDVPYISHTWRGGGTVAEKEQIKRLMTDDGSPAARILVVNMEALAVVDRLYDLCEEFLRKYSALMVVDESTGLKNYQSKRTKAAVSLRRDATGRRILTGYIGLPQDIYPQFDFLGPRLLGHSNFFSFRAEYCLMADIYVSQGKTTKKIVGYQNLERLTEVMDPHSFRAKKRDCFEIPEKQFLPPRYVEMTKEQRTLYKEMKETALATLSDGTVVSTTVVVNQIEKLHQITCGHIRLPDGTWRLLETNRVKDLISLLEETEEQVIIWCNYRPDQERVYTALCEAYGADSVARWTGAAPPAEKEQGELDFQAGRRRFMLASQSAGGRGRTWTAATLVVYYSNQHGLEVRLNSEDRAHRGGQTRQVSYVNMICQGTVDEGIIRAFRQNREITDMILRDGPEAWI